MKDALNKLSLMEHIESMNVNDGFDYLHSQVIKIIDKVAPYESFIPKKSNFCKDPWLPFGLLRSIKKQKLLFKKP